VVISELMVNPGGANQVSDDDGEWVEISNLVGGRLQLDGCELREDGADSAFVFPAGSRLQPGGWIVVARSGDPLRNGGVRPDYESRALRLANEEDGVTLSCGGTELDSVSWRLGSWPIHPGTSMSLDPARMSPQANDDPGSWCPSYRAIVPAGDRGTPGDANPRCLHQVPATCGDAIDVSEGGLFGWDLALSEAGPLTDHVYFGECDTPNAEGAYDIGVGSPDVAFSFSAPEDRRWTLDLWAVRGGADVAMYVWAGFCPRWAAEACADDFQEPGGEVRIEHARIDRVFRGGETYYAIVDGLNSATGDVDPQPFTLEVTRGAPE